MRPIDSPAFGWTPGAKIEVSDELVARIVAKRWTIFICAEPDGQDCDSGTHPNVCRHKCAALNRFHESGGREEGPRLVEVEVAWVGPVDEEA